MLHASSGRARLSLPVVRTLVPALSLVLVSASFATQAAHAQAPASLSPELTTVRAALDKYRDPVMAVHDGYMSLLGCIEYPQGSVEGSMKYVPGGMGVHFLNPAGVFSPTNPALKCPKGAYSFAEAAPKMVGHGKH